MISEAATRSCLRQSLPDQVDDRQAASKSFSTDGSFSAWLRLRGTRLLNHWITSRGSDHHRKVVPCCWPLTDRSHVLL